MICLTGDIHHASLGTGNQRHCDISEVQVAGRFLRLLERYDLKATFFVSGKAFAEEWTDLRPVATHPLVELGGHNWSCFQPALCHRISNKLLGSYPGPAWYERLDARRTIDVIRARTGQRIRAWRNHMYMHGPNTDRVLAACGMEVCSDGTGRESAGPEWRSAGLWHLPINVIPDHEHLYHAERTPEWVAWWVRRYQWSDDWGPWSYEIDTWVDLVLDDLRRNEARGAVSTLIIHPITMYLCDRFSGVERILEFIAARSTAHVSEVVRQAGDRHRIEVAA
jgi:peptidoglycan/xylan/chitin deacetylase (PgdA/CDA1 family)